MTQRSLSKSVGLEIDYLLRTCSSHLMTYLSEMISGKART